MPSKASISLKSLTSSSYFANASCGVTFAVDTAVVEANMRLALALLLPLAAAAAAVAAVVVVARTRWRKALAMVSPNRTRATTLTKEEKAKEQRRPLPRQVRKAMELCVCACVRWRVRGISDDVRGGCSRPSSIFAFALFLPLKARHTVATNAI